MNNVNGFGAYRQTMYDSTVQAKKEQQAAAKTGSTAKNDPTKKTENKQKDVQLSKAAKDLLQELQKKYGNMDFIVADYDSEEEAASYLSRGTKEFSVLIDPEELERMASDESVKEQNIGLLDEAVGQLKDLKEQLGDKEDEVLHMGVSIGKNGEMNFFAELEKTGERQKDFIDKMREDKKEAAKEEEEKKADAQLKEKYPYEQSKRTTVYADSAEELLEKIRNVDWDSIKEETTAETTGTRFDFTV